MRPPQVRKAREPVALRTRRHEHGESGQERRDGATQRRRPEQHEARANPVAAGIPQHASAAQGIGPLEDRSGVGDAHITIPIAQQRAEGLQLFRRLGVGVIIGTRKVRHQRQRADRRRTTQALHDPGK